MNWGTQIGSEAERMGEIVNKTPQSIPNATFEYCQPEAGRKSVRKPYRTRPIRIILKISEAQCFAIVHFKCASRKLMARHLAQQIQHTHTLSLQFNGLILWENERTILYLLQNRLDSNKQTYDGHIDKF